MFWHQFHTTITILQYQRFDMETFIYKMTFPSFTKNDSAKDEFNVPRVQQKCTNMAACRTLLWQRSSVLERHAKVHSNVWLRRCGFLKSASSHGIEPSAALISWHSSSSALRLIPFCSSVSSTSVDAWLSVYLVTSANMVDKNDLPNIWFLHDFAKRHAVSCFSSFLW